MSERTDSVVAIVVDYHADDVLVACVESLVVNDVGQIVVVENGEVGSVPTSLNEHGVVVVRPGVNLGYGRGVNRGLAAAGPARYILILNPDVVVHDGALEALVEYLEENPDVALVGPAILRPDGTLYPSRRDFPNVLLAAAHALLSPIWSGNPATKRYRATRHDGMVDWVSGACFLIRRSAFEEAGGFDERYFMFAEDMALCWRVRELGYQVAATSRAVVTHIEGVSRARVPRQMLVAHHVGAMKFELQTARGWRRVLAPLAVLILTIRLAIVLLVRREG